MPLISPPEFEKDFILYISTSHFVVARFLVQYGLDECKNIIYYVSKNLYGPPCPIYVMRIWPRLLSLLSKSYIIAS